jgi:hypothetical protein
LPVSDHFFIRFPVSARFALGCPFPTIFSSGFIRFPVSEHFGADGAEFHPGSAFGDGVARHPLGLCTTVQYYDRAPTRSQLGTPAPAAPEHPATKRIISVSKRVDLFVEPGSLTAERLG